MYTKLTILYIILLLLASCASNPVYIETKYGEMPKLKINTPYDPCKLRSKRNGVRIKCKWILGKQHKHNINNHTIWHNDPTIKIIQSYRKLKATYDLKNHTFHYE